MKLKFQNYHQLWLVIMKLIFVINYFKLIFIRKTFPNYLLRNIKLSKTQLSKMIQSEGFLGRLPGPLLKTRLPLIKNLIKPLNKSVSIALGLTAAASTADTGIHEKKFRIKK